MRLATIFALACALISSGVAKAACAGYGAPAAKVLSFSAQDADTTLGLSVALNFGLDPPSFPSQQIAAAINPCRRATFKLGDATYGVFDVDTGLPPRWAFDAANPSRVAFIALMPSPEAGLASYRHDSKASQLKGKTADFMYVLAVTDTNDRRLFRFYSALPDDTRSASDMCAALAGELPVIGTYHTDTAQSDLDHLGDVAPPVAISACHVTLASPSP